MTDTHAKIRGKGLDATGITEDLASELFNKVGTHIMAIVDLQVVDRHGPDVKGKRGVELIIDGIEPAQNEDMAEHLRELTRTNYLVRKQADGQMAIDDSLGSERTVEDVMAAGARHKPHPFLPVDASIDNGICDVCGAIESVAIHSMQDTLPGDDEGDQEDERDPYDDVHAKHGEDTVCGLRATIGKSLRRHEDTDQVTCPDCLERLDELQAASPDPGPWEYDQPEGTDRPVTTIPDPFTPTPA